VGIVTLYRIVTMPRLLVWAMCFCLFWCGCCRSGALRATLSMIVPGVIEGGLCSHSDCFISTRAPTKGNLPQPVPEGEWMELYPRPCPCRTNLYIWIPRPIQCWCIGWLWFVREGITCGSHRWEATQECEKIFLAQLRCWTYRFVLHPRNDPTLNLDQWNISKW